MSAKVKSPEMIMIVVMAAILLWGVNLMNDSSTDATRKVCFEAYNKPARRTHLTWSVSAKNGRESTRVGTWEHCETAHPGDSAWLLVVPVGRGTTRCRIWAVVGGVDVPINNNSAINGGWCRANGVVP